MAQVWYTKAVKRQMWDLDRIREIFHISIKTNVGRDSEREKRTKEKIKKKEAEREKEAILPNIEWVPRMGT